MKTPEVVYEETTITRGRTSTPHTCPSCKAEFEIPDKGPARRPVPEIGPAPPEDAEPAHRTIARWRAGLVGFGALHRALSQAAEDDDGRYRAMMQTAMGDPRWQDTTGDVKLRRAVATLRADPEALAGLRAVARDLQTEAPAAAVTEALDILCAHPRFRPARTREDRARDVLCAIARCAAGRAAPNAVQGSTREYVQTGERRNDRDAEVFARALEERAVALYRAHVQGHDPVHCPQCGSTSPRNDPDTAWQASQRATDCAVALARALSLVDDADPGVERRVRERVRDVVDPDTAGSSAWQCVRQGARYVDGMSDAVTVERLIHAETRHDPATYRALLDCIATHEQHA